MHGSVGPPESSPQTAHSRVSLYFSVGRPFPLKLPLLIGIRIQDRHLIHDSLSQSVPCAHNLNGISIGSAVFCTAHRTVSLYFTMGRPSSPLKIAPSHRGSKPISTPWFLGPTRFLNRNCTLIGSAVCTADYLDRPTDRPTDRQTTLFGL